MSLTACLLVMLGGAAGSLLRYVASLALLAQSRDLPWGTIGVNVAGSLLIGVLAALIPPGGRNPQAENLRLLLMVGLCGGFTTFSSFSLQTLALLRNGAPLRACLNVALSVVLCTAAVAVGHAAARLLPPAAAAVAMRVRG